MKTSVYCTAPFNGLTIRENGQVKTCCVGSLTLGNLNDVSIFEIEKSVVLKEIQQDMLSDSPNFKNCQMCLGQEQTSGIASLRQHYLQHYPDIDRDRLALKFIDIRWNNICNLGCLYCGSNFSSIWENRLNRPTTVLKKSYQDELLAWILERIDHVKEIMLVGGEPMLMKQNYELLKRLPIDCRISIITNLSYDLEKLPCISDLLRRPSDKVVWNVSIENIGDKFEYVRSGASWSQVSKNFIFLKKHWPESISLSMVYSVFSAFDLSETIDYFRSFGIKKINLSAIYGNREINVTSLPTSIRKVAADQLAQVRERHIESLHPDDRDLYTLDGIDDLLDALLSNTNVGTTTLTEFDEKIKWYDQWGQKKFAELWSDTNEMIRRAF